MLPFLLSSSRISQFQFSSWEWQGTCKEPACHKQQVAQSFEPGPKMTQSFAAAQHCWTSANWHQLANPATESVSLVACLL